MPGMIFGDGMLVVTGRLVKEATGMLVKTGMAAGSRSESSGWRWDASSWRACTATACLAYGTAATTAMSWRFEPGPEGSDSAARTWCWEGLTACGGGGGASVRSRAEAGPSVDPGLGPGPELELPARPPESSGNVRSWVPSGKATALRRGVVPVLGYKLLGSEPYPVPNPPLPRMGRPELPELWLVGVPGMDRVCPAGVPGNGTGVLG